MVGQIYIGLTTLLTSLSLTSSGTWIYLLMPDSAFSLQESALSSLILNTSHHFQTPCTLSLSDSHTSATAWCTAEVLVSVMNWPY